MNCVIQQQRYQDGPRSVVCVSYYFSLFSQSVCVCVFSRAHYLAKLSADYSASIGNHLCAFITPPPPKHPPEGSRRESLVHLPGGIWYRLLYIETELSEFNTTINVYVYKYITFYVDQFLFFSFF